MKNLTVTLTFKPLNRGWFKCIQTGEKTKNCERYRRSHRNLAVSAVKNANKIKMGSFNLWNCPSCRYINDKGVLKENNICTVCGKVVYLYTNR